MLSLEFQLITSQFAIADSIFFQLYPEICKQQFRFDGVFCSGLWHCSNLDGAYKWRLLLLLSAVLNRCTPQLVFRKSLQLSALWPRLKKSFEGCIQTRNCIKLISFQFFRRNVRHIKEHMIVVRG